MKRFSIFVVTFFIVIFASNVIAWKKKYYFEVRDKNETKIRGCNVKENLNDIFSRVYDGLCDSHIVRKEKKTIYMLYTINQDITSVCHLCDDLEGLDYFMRRACRTHVYQKR